MPRLTLVLLQAAPPDPEALTPVAVTLGVPAAAAALSPRGVAAAAAAALPSAAVVPTAAAAPPVPPAEVVPPEVLAERELHRRFDDHKGPSVARTPSLRPGVKPLDLALGVTIKLELGDPPADVAQQAPPEAMPEAPVAPVDGGASVAASEQPRAADEAAPPAAAAADDTPAEAADPAAVPPPAAPTEERAVGAE